MESALIIGAVSFEERCLAMLKLLPKFEEVELHVLDYGRRATPDDWAGALRQKHYGLIEEGSSAASHVRLRRVHIDPYSSEDLRRHVVDSLGSISKDTKVIIDLSCVTRLQAVSFGAIMAEWHNEKWQIQYAVPASYRFEQSSRGAPTGWLGTLLVAVSGTPELQQEGESRGLVLVGHEADRLAVALEEFEAAGGSVVGLIPPRRPDITAAVLKRNEPVLSRLRSMEFARVEGDSLVSYGRSWNTVLVGLLEVGALRQAVRAEIDLARSAQAPLFFYPFGPKLAVFVCAFEIATLYPEGSWAVYPVATTHGVNSAEGVGDTFSVSASELRVSAPA